MCNMYTYIHIYTDTYSLSPPLRNTLQSKTLPFLNLFLTAFWTGIRLRLAQSLDYIPKLNVRVISAKYELLLHSDQKCNNCVRNSLC